MGSAGLDWRLVSNYVHFQINRHMITTNVNNILLCFAG